LQDIRHVISFLVKLVVAAISANFRPKCLHIPRRRGKAAAKLFTAFAFGSVAPERSDIFL
jgi:hypothetical protein